MVLVRQRSAPVSKLAPTVDTRSISSSTTSNSGLTPPRFRRSREATVKLLAARAAMQSTDISREFGLAAFGGFALSALLVKTL
jgi:hypothetical protein